MRKVTCFVCFFCCAVYATAHPHMWFDCEFEVVFNQGVLQGVYVNFSARTLSQDMTQAMTEYSTTQKQPMCFKMRLHTPKTISTLRLYALAKSVSRQFTLTAQNFRQHKKTACFRIGSLLTFRRIKTCMNYISLVMIILFFVTLVTQNNALVLQERQTCQNIRFLKIKAIQFTITRSVRWMT